MFNRHSINIIYHKQINNTTSTLGSIGKLRDFITKNYYTCTNDIFAGLGQMYVADERFKKNIYKYGEGTAEFASEAIAVFCQEK